MRLQNDIHTVKPTLIENESIDWLKPKCQQLLHFESCGWLVFVTSIKSDAMTKRTHLFYVGAHSIILRADLLPGLWETMGWQFGI